MMGYFIKEERRIEMGNKLGDKTKLIEREWGWNEKVDKYIAELNLNFSLKF